MDAPDLATEVAELFAECAARWQPDADLLAEARAEWLRRKDAERKRVARERARFATQTTERRCCPACGVSFVLFERPRGGRLPAYCSRRCRVRAFRLRAA